MSVNGDMLQAPTIAAAAYLRLAGRPPVLPSSNLSYSENFLYMLDSLYVIWSSGVLIAIWIIINNYVIICSHYGISACFNTIHYTLFILFIFSFSFSFERALLNVFLFLCSIVVGSIKLQNEIQIVPHFCIKIYLIFDLWIFLCHFT